MNAYIKRKAITNWWWAVHRKAYSMADVIVIMILGLCVGGAIRYIYKSKKSGAKCIGCPHSCSCSGNCSGSANNGNTKNSSANSKENS